MVSTQKIVKTFSKILLSSTLYGEEKFKKHDFLRKYFCFTAPFFCMQLPDCRRPTIYSWHELFKRKRMTYYLSILCFYFVKLLNFKHFPCFATCREDKNG